MSGGRDFHALVAALYELQNDRCGICGGLGRDLMVDHDHDNGMVRGLLCRACNVHEAQHHCTDPKGCRYCIWERTPAVAWIGWTVHYQTEFPNSIVDEAEFRRKKFVTAEARADRYERQLAQGKAVLRDVFAPVSEARTIEAHQRRAGELAAERKAAS